MADQEMIAVKLDAIAQAMAQAAGIMSCCMRTPSLQEKAIPYNAHQFSFSGEIFQTISNSEGSVTLSYQQSILLRVPQGQTGVITSFAVGEHMPGIMAGARISLLVNGEAIPAYPQVSGLVGLGTGVPQETWIPLPEAAEVAIFLNNIWVTNTNSEAIDFGIPFEVNGYYLDREYFQAAANNASVPVGPIDSSTIDFKNLQIPEANIATSS